MITTLIFECSFSKQYTALHNWAKVNIKLIYIKSKCLPFLLPYKHEYDSLQLTYHFIYQFHSRMIVLVQSSFHTTWASLFEMELEPNSLDWNGNELEHELELEDMKRNIYTLWLV